MCVQPAASAPISSLFLLLLLLLFPYASPMTFSFTDFQPGDPNITFQGDASAVSSVAKLTDSEPWSAGRVVFSRPVRLSVNKTLTSFTTTFKFGIKPSGNSYGDGVAFFLAPRASGMPSNSAGGYLGLFENSTGLAAASSGQLVAVEFDTKTDEWDPPYPHVGFDVGSIRSFRTGYAWGANRSSGSLLSFHATVTFDGSSRNLTVKYVIGGGPTNILSHSPLDDIQTALPEWVNVGLSAATSEGAVTHEIYSWDFDSTLKTGEEEFTGPSLGGGDTRPGERTKNVLFRVVVVIGAVAAVIAVGIIACLILTRCRKKSTVRMKERSLEMRIGGGNAFTPFQDMGPREFSYGELELATDNFNEERKLGKGAFGIVYLGRCGDLDRAIKSFKGEGQIINRSFQAEVRAIGRLGHRNLVPLVGWCIASSRQFFIVYDYMPNRSLDLHLFSDSRTGQMAYPLLSWDKRYAVVLGLASALKYLHEEWVQCVVHRDIKPANVMLDAHFNARLGDFGLSRHFEHDESMPSTEFAGTLAYMAPEVRRREQKPSKQSDVYSFGVVAFTVATGRRASFQPTDAEEEEESLVTWVRRRHRRGGEDHMLGAADERLRGVYEEGQMRCLMKVGLWCTLPDRTQRPTMSQVAQYLSFQAPVPELPVMSEEPPRSDGAVPDSKPPSISSSVKHFGR